MRKSIDFGLSVIATDEPDDYPPMSWIVGVADIFDDAIARVFVVLEEQGQPAYGQTLYLAPDDARRVRAALGTALREMGESPGP